MTDRKFLLIYCAPPGLDDYFISQPLGILYLGAILEEAGVSVKCVDERTFSREEIESLSDLLKRFSVSLYESEEPLDGSCLRCAAYIEKNCPVGHVRGGCPYQEGRVARSGRTEPGETP